LGGAYSSLGDAESSLGDAKSSLGDAYSSLGDAKSSLGDIQVATEAGTIDAFNLQSGLHRGSFSRFETVGGSRVGPAPPAMATKTLLAAMQRNEAEAQAGAGATRPAHDSGVVKVAVDACNKWMVRHRRTKLRVVIRV
jgi:hypothetical protein